MSEQDLWQWQQEGTSWKGVGIYHLTLTVTSREPLLGKLVIPNNDPKLAYVERTALGQAVLDCQRSIPIFHPEIQILQYSLMPDHLHSIWYVRRPMEKSIRYAAQSFWRAAKKAGRACSYMNACLSGGAIDESGLSGGATSESGLSGGAMNESGLSSGAMNESGGAAGLSISSLAPALSRENVLCKMLGVDDYSRLAPIFTEVPFIRPMSRRGQLQSMIRYVQLNAQRLDTKRLLPGFFRVQENIVVADRTYAGVGNLLLLQAAHFGTVHVHHEWVDEAAQGKPQRLRDYMNGCVLAARRGTVLVSPFISPKEKAVQDVLLAEQHPFIVLADNGFRDYYKPSDHLFDAVAAGRVLILSAWEYDSNKRHITRADCVALNAMAEEIASI